MMNNIQAPTRLQRNQQSLAKQKLLAGPTLFLPSHLQDNVEADVLIVVEIKKCPSIMHNDLYYQIAWHPDLLELLWQSGYTECVSLSIYKVPKHDMF